MNLIINRSNNLGIITSSVCLVHCLATPFLFIAKLGTNNCCETAPMWWTLLDYLFLVIAFFAVYQSGRMTSRKWMREALWLSWIGLFLVIMNEKIEALPLAEYAIYFPTLSLIFLHFYNRKFCHCQTDESYVDKTEKS